MNVYIRRAEHVKKKRHKNFWLLSGRLFNVCKDFNKTSFGRNFAQWGGTISKGTIFPPKGFILVQ